MWRDTRRAIGDSRRILDELLPSPELPSPEVLPEDCDPALERLVTGVYLSQAALASSLTTARTSDGANRRGELAANLRLLAVDAANLELSRIRSGLLEAAGALDPS
ncbi:hypothetical protein [Agrococcus baldri]|uniref:Uncharacterized protein n=1 Tax=Agrococcus baldri TaxID=153730 RepID=A0AA87UWF2_9MICO|nr:hypothetical protein [Agrococcus baldri]GEK79412.1 hypothetical protein ABA31_07630 [Agrococcus baldri]